MRISLSENILNREVYVTYFARDNLDHFSITSDHFFDHFSITRDMVRFFPRVNVSELVMMFPVGIKVNSG